MTLEKTILDKMTINELAVYLAGRKDLSAQEVVILEADQRSGVAELLRRYINRKEALFRESDRLEKMLVEEKVLWNQGYKAVAGVDEAGRGPLAGPVLAGAVIFKPGTVIDGVNDSKQLSQRRRELLFEKIIQEAETYGIGSASRKEIDELNIHAASMLAMRRALECLNCKPDYLLVDGFQIKELACRQRALKHGDSRSISIAAASILAKVARDKIMDDLHHKYPCYGFNRNMGYGTAEHRQAIIKYGPCPEHRQSFNLSD